MFTMPGQGWLQLEELTLAFVLSALVGLEREFRQKSAGLRTYTLVGVSAALFMLISKYGFMDVLAADRIVLDPSRVAAQVVSGIGFIGGGVIFMRRDVVRGLTTAATVWLTAALGMACGAGLPLLALATTVGHFVIMFVFPRLADRIPRARRTATRLRIVYTDRRGLLQSILAACTQLRFAIDQIETEHAGLTRRETSEEARDRADWEGTDAGSRMGDGQSDDVALLKVVVKGKRPVSMLIASLGDIPGVVSVTTGDDELEFE